MAHLWKWFSQTLSKLGHFGFVSLSLCCDCYSNRLGDHLEWAPMSHMALRAITSSQIWLWSWLSLWPTSRVLSCKNYGSCQPPHQGCGLAGRQHLLLPSTLPAKDFQGILQELNPGPGEYETDALRLFYPHKPLLSLSLHHITISIHSFSCCFKFMWITFQSHPSYSSLPSYIDRWDIPSSELRRCSWLSERWQHISGLDMCCSLYLTLDQQVVFSVARITGVANLPPKDVV